jgi:hypothetical protein
MERPMGMPTPYNGSVMSQNISQAISDRLKLNQSELNSLSKQKNLKMHLKSNLMGLDQGRKRTISFEKFKMEAKSLGIVLSDTDLNNILHLFENKKNFNNVSGIPEIDYEQAIKHINPTLSRNNDPINMNKQVKSMLTMASSVGANSSFSIKWSLSKAARLKADQMKRNRDEEGLQSNSPVTNGGRFETLP